MCDQRSLSLSVATDSLEWQALVAGHDLLPLHALLVSIFIHIILLPITEGHTVTVSHFSLS